jgi:hypothetical protein
LLQQAASALVFDRDDVYRDVARADIMLRRYPACGMRLMYPKISMASIA